MAVESKQNCEKWWNHVTQLDHLNTTWIWFKKQFREVHSSLSSCRHKSVPNWSQKCLPNATQMQSLWPLGRANKLAKFCLSVCLQEWKKVENKAKKPKPTSWPSITHFKNKVLPQHSYSNHILRWIRHHNRNILWWKRHKNNHILWWKRQPQMSWTVFTCQE